MSESGYIDWHRLCQSWQDTGEGSTFVYAFWLSDHRLSGPDPGLTILKKQGAHPDWFIHADSADCVLYSVCRRDWVVSPNLTEIYDTHLTSRPALASVCLGTTDAVYADASRTSYWWCGYDDLIRPGKKLIRQLSTLYLRPPVILTYLSLSPMSPSAPGS